MTEPEKQNGYLLEECLLALLIVSITTCLLTAAVQGLRNEYFRGISYELESEESE